MTVPQRGRGVRKAHGQPSSLELLARKGKSPVGEDLSPPSSPPEYDRARETRSESTGTTP
jgi:hypothetical protein